MDLCVILLKIMRVGCFFLVKYAKYLFITFVGSQCLMEFSKMCTDYVSTSILKLNLKGYR